MQRTTANLGFIAAIVIGMTACTSSDYSNNKSDSTATVSADSSTGTASTAMAGDSATTKTVKKKKKGKTTINFPMANNEKITRDNDGVYNRAETMPEFPGGQDALSSYINQHLDYSQKAIDNSTDGTIHISFVVDENGKVVDPKLIGTKKLGDGLDEETLRVFNSMPSWKPGIVNGKKVKTRLEVPITFQLEDA
jgi:protein TonB